MLCVVIVERGVERERERFQTKNKFQKKKKGGGETHLDLFGEAWALQCGSSLRTAKSVFKMLCFIFPPS